jgi:FlaA1/EpsC-like NDP-sugar epimerase
MIRLSSFFRNEGRPNGGPSLNGLRRCLIVGSGRAGSAILRDLIDTPEFGLSPIGFLDDNPRKRRVLGAPVLGRTSDLASICRERQVDVVIVAIPGLAALEFNRLVREASAIGVDVRYLPSFLAAIERDAHLTDLRRMRFDRLLHRNEMQVVRSKSRSVAEGKVVLVTGAGGSIGTELCRQIESFKPRALYMLDHDESNLHRLQMELDGKALLDSNRIVIADIRDDSRIRQIFQQVRPQVVFHAAAHKHLPLLELHPCEGVKTNVLGTMQLAEAAVREGTETFILISTDKAADPTSILGATKRLAELIVTLYASGRTKFASVRFGNVLGSRGSFLSVLSEQFESGVPITITHPDVTRFFMTVEEAVGLVIEAASMADSGETFVLDMGDPLRIVDLVHAYADQLHVEMNEASITYTGLRPGEKLSESLFGAGEERIPTAHPKIWATRTPQPPPEMPALLSELFASAAINHADQVRSLLSLLVPGFTPSLPGSLVSALAAPYPDDF